MVGALRASRHELDDETRREQPARTVVVTTTPGFASLWLIRRLAGFTATRPDVDVRISAACARANLNRDGFDLSIRCPAEAAAGEAAEWLFGEGVLPMCSPRVLRRPLGPLKTLDRLRPHVLRHLDSRPGADKQGGPVWRRAIKLGAIKPTRRLHFSQFHKLLNAAIDCQCTALGRSPLLDEHVHDRMLVAPFKKAITAPRSD